MGAYIGSLIGKLGNSYLDERQNQDVLKETRDRQARAEALAQQKATQDAFEAQNNFDVMLRRLDEQDKSRMSAEQRAEAERAMRERIEQMRLDAQTSREATRDKQWQEGQANLDRRLQTSLGAAEARQQRSLAAQASKAQGGQRLRAPTEAQEKSAIYYGLMENAVPEMDRLGWVVDPNTGERKPNPNIRPLAIKAALSVWGGNAVLNKDEQEYLKYARDFAAGVLRKESGAAVRDQELRDTFNRYIDAPFDEPNTRKVKSASRSKYMSLMERSARPALQYYDASKNGGIVDTTVDPDFGGQDGAVSGAGLVSRNRNR